MSKNFDHEFAEPDAGPPSSRFRHQQFREAFNEAHPDLMAIPPEEFLHINLNIEAAVSTALACEPKVHRFHDLIVQLPHYNAKHAKKLKLYAMALWYANGLYTQSIDPLEPLAEIGAELIKLREKLLLDAQVLIAHGILDGGFVDDLNRNVGYLNVASDVTTLTMKIRLNWHKCEGKTPLTLADLDHAAGLAERMAFAFGTREQQQLNAGKAVEIRARAFTLMVRAYDQVRRAFIFLRWQEGDADEIAPSLYGGRVVPKKDTDPTDGTAAAGSAAGGAAPAGAAGTATPGGSAGAAAPGKATTGATPGASTGAAAGATPASPVTSATATTGTPVASPTTASATGAVPTVTTTSSVTGGVLSVETSAAPGMPGHDPYGRT